MARRPSLRCPAFLNSTTSSTIVVHGEICEQNELGVAVVRSCTFVAAWLICAEALSVVSHTK